VSKSLKKINFAILRPPLFCQNDWRLSQQSGEKRVSRRPPHTVQVQYSIRQQKQFRFQINEKTMMDIFKNFVGRRNMVGITSETSQYQKEIKKADPFSYRPPALVTSTSFDSDERFMIVAKLLLFRYEKEGCSVKDAINATLTTSEEKQAFLEALDLRQATIQFQQDDEMIESPMDALVGTTRSIFVHELKCLWRQCILSGDETTDCRSQDSYDLEFHRPLKTPKHNIHSPIQSEIQIKSSEKFVSTQPKSSKLRRRRFFADGDQSRRRSSIRIEFKLSGTQPVESLQLDCISQPPLGSYAPPSPIVAR
jgi:hypothetical protein